jgi:D-alanyl-D-alanine carboxypeptidase
MRPRGIGPILAVALLAPVLASADRIDDYVAARVKEFHLPGLSLVVIKNGQIVKAQGYGLADVENKIPAQADTVYKIGSVSKQFIATGIMLLVQDGRIALGDPVGKYIPAAPAAWKPITIRHLLTHTSGIVRESPAFSPIRDEPEAQVFKAALSVPLRFVPGEKWEYSNVGYYALAEIISAIAGAPWTEYLHEKLFTPAGLATTFPTNTTRSVINLAAGYTSNDNDRKAGFRFPFRPSGAFLSTILDLARWDAALDSDRILSEASRRQMWSPVRLKRRDNCSVWFWLARPLDERQSPRAPWRRIAGICRRVFEICRPAPDRHRADQWRRRGFAVDCEWSCRAVPAELSAAGNFC